MPSKLSLIKMGLMTKLYHYIHCPFCVRVRFALGLLEIPYQSLVLSYEDEDTPLNLTGVKMLPIAEIEGKTMNESLSIIKALDSENTLQTNLLDNEDQMDYLEDLLNRLGKPIHNLAMPYWIYTKEFNQQSRDYFQKKKEIKRGPFNKVAQRKEEFFAELTPLLDEVEKSIGPFFLKQKDFTIYDILIASHLWGLYIVPEFQFSPFLHRYLQMVRKVCQFNYHEDFWNGALGN